MRPGNVYVTVVPSFGVVLQVCWAHNSNLGTQVQLLTQVRTSLQQQLPLRVQGGQKPSRQLADAYMIMGSLSVPFDR